MRESRSKSGELVHIGGHELVFSFDPTWRGEVPPVFRVAPRAVRLLEREDPRVLILGFGLGAMAGFLLRERPQALVTGVEPDTRSVERARTCFGKPHRILHMSAEQFLGDRRRRSRFDLVIDDCYTLGTDNAASRPPSLDGSAALVKRILRDERSILVRNLLADDAGLEASKGDIEAVFPYRLERRFRAWENILLLARNSPFPDDARTRLRT